MTRPVQLSLTADQALVLYDWLARETEGEGVPLEHPAERYVLWELEGQLDKRLLEPFLPEYRALLADARERVLRSKQDEG